MNEQKSATWGEVVCYLDGFCYGIAPDGHTVCLGTEEEIKSLLEENRRADNPLVNKILDLERELKGNTNGKLQRPGDFRSRPARKVKHRTNHVRQAPKRKRIPVRSAKQQVQGVSSK